MENVARKFYLARSVFCLWPGMAAKLGLAWHGLWSSLAWLVDAVPETWLDWVLDLVCVGLDWQGQGMVWVMFAPQSACRNASMSLDKGWPDIA